MSNKVQEAIKIYGSDLVEEVQLAVDMGDADGAYALFQDMGMDEWSECVEFIYFENK